MKALVTQLPGGTWGPPLSLSCPDTRPPGCVPSSHALGPKPQPEQPGPAPSAPRRALPGLTRPAATPRCPGYQPSRPAQLTLHVSGMAGPQTRELWCHSPAWGLPTHGQVAQSLWLPSPGHSHTNQHPPPRSCKCSGGHCWGLHPHNPRSGNSAHSLNQAGTRSCTQWGSETPSPPALCPAIAHLPATWCSCMGRALTLQNPSVLASVPFGRGKHDTLHSLVLASAAGPRGSPPHPGQLLPRPPVTQKMLPSLPVTSAYPLRATRRAPGGPGCPLQPTWPERSRRRREDRQTQQQKADAHGP